MNIQWYPGHMAKTKRLMADAIRQVDAVCELVDARIPLASRNPDIGALAKEKPRMLILNRADQADPESTAAWLSYFREQGFAAMEADAKSGAGISAFAPEIRTLLADKLRRYEEKGMAGRPVKVMIAGIPNVGKSSFINRVLKRKSAKAEDRPGVTRKTQWFAVDTGIEMLDTPGILPPKLENEQAGLLLAFTGAIKDEILDVETLACHLMYWLATRAPGQMSGRYTIEIPACEKSEEPGCALAVEPRVSYGYGLLCAAALARGFKIGGGGPDTERMAKTLLDEFRGGKLGRITLETPPEEKR